MAVNYSNHPIVFNLVADVDCQEGRLDWRNFGGWVEYEWYQNGVREKWSVGFSIGHFKLEGFEGVAMAILVADSPTVFRPDRAPVPQVLSRAIDECEIGASRTTPGHAER